ncbi:MAG: DUF2911 domain-containing protein [Ferruginibacter sp.]
MKYLFSLSMMSLLLFITTSSNAQEDKSKRPSPPALVKQKVGKTQISIDYSQPSVKGRTIGVDLEPKPGEVWRTGANEATIFEVDNDVKVEGKVLPKGKYALFTLVNDDNWTIIFNKTWKQWGAFKYSEAEDALRVDVKAVKSEAFAEKMTFTIDEDGKVNLLWGDKKVRFTVK